MKKTINKFVIVTALLMILCSNIFAQGNFTTEWESPVGWRFEAYAKMNSASNVISMIFAEIGNEHNIRIYNGSTHNLEYNWTSNGTYSFLDASSIYAVQEGYSPFMVDKFDVTGEGINEIIQQDAGDVDNIVNPQNGNVLYSSENLIHKIMDIDADGFAEIIEISFESRIKIISTISATVSIENNNQILKNYELKQNYPNPFNPNTTIEYNLNRSSEVKVIIYDILGKEISKLVNEKQPTGKYKINVNASGLSSGTYFYSLVVDGLADTKKMILIK